MELKILLKKVFFYFNLSFIFVTISTLSLVFLPLINVKNEKTNSFFIIVVALLFWCGVIGEMVAVFLTCKYRRLIEKKHKKKNNKKIGALAFFRNREAKICDIAMLITVFMLAVFSLMKIQNFSLNLFFFILFYVFIHLHCYLNGKNYLFIKKIIKKQGDNKNGKANNQDN